ncbi:LOW QUALITY PROTEIN: hypothetical protein PHMEG_00025293 [Phytophthora megakarya]|uniref:Uncharacterized protein n=1 Tax=Phytophthora megakarya TaxID=4795 RepID=A0A225VD55_9STRA|nr:LOW QUALITY PROTEIN: hypothetical protein PHMEG_00025293 [Phytophthora megakarya]
MQVERPLSTVQEEAASEVSTALTERSPLEVPLARPTSESGTPRSPVTIDAHDEDMAPAQAEDVNQAGVPMTEVQAKFYVASQCQRWKEAPAGWAVPPRIRYDWQFGKPDSQAHYWATLQTSKYLEQRMSVESQGELRVCRNTFGLELDLIGIMIPGESLSPIKCVATIQTLLAESGFGFQDVITVWSEALISKIHPDLIQLVCDDLQRFLSVELPELRQLISEATRRLLSGVEPDVLMTVSDGQTSKSVVVVDGYPEDQDGDAYITTQEAQLLGHTFARQVTASGLQRAPSSQSSVGEPEPKRPQRQPPRPNMSSIPSASTLQSYSSSDVTARGVRREVPSTSSMRSSSEFSSGIFTKRDVRKPSITRQRVRFARMVLWNRSWNPYAIHTCDAASDDCSRNLWNHSD